MQKVKKAGLFFFLIVAAVLFYNSENRINQLQQKVNNQVLRSLESQNSDLFFKLENNNHQKQALTINQTYGLKEVELDLKKIDTCKKFKIFYFIFLTLLSAVIGGEIVKGRD